jgi:hypothetical protein
MVLRQKWEARGRLAFSLIHFNPPQINTQISNYQTDLPEQEKGEKSIKTENNKVLKINKIPIFGNY